MTTDTALPELRRRLSDVGFDEDAPDVALFWRVLRDWATVPVEGMDPERDADMLLYECSLDLKPADAYHAGPAFFVGFTRQFSFEDEQGEYAGMAQLHATLVYEVHDDFRQITTMASWSETFGTADLFWGNGAHRATAWADRVERTRSYQTARRHQPVRLTLHYGPV
jgi:hypothetical protein